MTIRQFTRRGKLQGLIPAWRNTRVSENVLADSSDTARAVRLLGDRSASPERRSTARRRYGINWKFTRRRANGRRRGSPLELADARSPF